MTEVVLSPGVIVEHVGGELLVVVPGHTDVVKLTGGVAKVLEDIRAGKPVDLSAPAVSDLVALGIVSTPGVSRRGLIKAGAIGAGAGIAVLAMPGVAAAASDSCPLVLPVAGGEDIVFYPDGGQYLNFLGGSNFSVRYEFLPNGTYYFDFIIPDGAARGTIAAGKTEHEFDAFEGGIATQYGFLLPGEAQDLPDLLSGITVVLYSDSARNCVINTVSGVK
jgi:hypothetical protein